MNENEGPAETVNPSAGDAGAPEYQDVPEPRGSFDMITDEGWALGWAWYPDAPTERVEVEFLIDGEVAGSTIAQSHRGDVAAAGMGDGNYGFSWPLPYQIMMRPRATEVLARDKRSGRLIPDPRSFKQQVVADALEKIASLEAELAQLHEAMARLTAQTRAETQEAGDLFRTVGDFFVRLAVATEAGAPPGSLKPLQAAVAEITSQYPRLTFLPPAAPYLAVCLDAAAPFDVTYRNLRTARDTAMQEGAVFSILDGGQTPEAPLLPAVLRNVAYLRLHDRLPVARLNEAARHAGPDILVFIGPHLEPVAGWAEAIRAAFARAPAPGMLAARITAPDLTLESAGVALHDGMILPRCAVDAAQECEVDAAAPEAFAVRREVWEEIGGLDELYAGAGPALAAFGRRAAGLGHAVRYAPGFHLLNTEAGRGAPPGMAAQDDAARLRQDIAAMVEAAPEESVFDGE